MFSFGPTDQATLIGPVAGFEDGRRDGFSAVAVSSRPFRLPLIDLRGIAAEIV